MSATEPSLPGDPRLEAWLRGLPSAAVALSGGVDSSLVAAAAARALGPRALAVTGDSASLPPGELDRIRGFCRAIGLDHEVVRTAELEDPDYVRNDPDRCYHCKSELYRAVSAAAATRGFAVVLDGTNADDLHGHRPGRRAAGEAGVRSPLVELGMSKSEVRSLARQFGLPQADRPSSPCLSSRIAYGVPVDAERLDRVGRAEELLRRRGFPEVRVRLHGPIARIEVPRADVARAAADAEALAAGLGALGFTWVTLDLLGLRSGSLLEVFAEERD